MLLDASFPFCFVWPMSVSYSDSITSVTSYQNASPDPILLNSAVVQLTVSREWTNWVENKLQL